MLCEDLHRDLSAQMARYASDQVVFVVDQKIQTSTVLDRYRNLVFTLFLPVTESQKTLETVQQVWDFFFEKGLTRYGLVVAIGGGVLTDLVGFAAATYKRGIDYINIPTTLLSMVDASTGGKTGINYHGLKNGIGLFAPPVETIIWPGWLKTLPAQEFLSGFAEMLKTGLIGDQRLWEALMQYDLDKMPLDRLAPMIEACVEAKERIVDADPKEEGLRKVLNFGHTFGHALEQLSIIQLSVIPHGYAVLYGMIAEMYLSVVQLGCPKEPLQGLTQIMLHYYGKPQCKCSDRSKLIKLMQQDKKNERAAEINCTLIRSIGDPVINQVITVSEAEEAFDYLFSL